MKAEQEQTRLRALEAQQRRKSEQVATFLSDTLKGVGPSVARGRDTAMLRAILDMTAERLRTDLKNQPEVETELRLTLGSVYRELGEYEKAVAMHREAMAMRKKLLGDQHPKVTTALDELARSLASFAITLKRRGDLAEAEALYRELLARQEKLGADVARRGMNFASVGWVLYHQGKFAEAEAIYRDGLEVLSRSDGKENLGVAVVVAGLAWLLVQENRFVEAEPLARASLNVREKLAPDAWQTFSLRSVLGASLLGQNTAAPSCAITSVAGSHGISGTLQPAAGAEAKFQSEATFTGER